MLRKEIPTAGDIFERRRTYAGVMQDKIELSSDRTASDRGYRHTDEARSNTLWTRSTPAGPPHEIRLAQPYQTTARREAQPQHTDELSNPPSNDNAQTNAIPTQNTPPAPAQTGNDSPAGSNQESLVPFTTQIRRTLKAEIQRQAEGADLSDSAAGAALLEKAIQGSLMQEYAAELRPVMQDQIHKDIQRFSNRTANIALEAFYSSEESRILTIYTLRFILGDAELLAEVIEEARIEARESLKRYSYSSAEAPEGEAYEQNPQQEVVN
jgi:hypothetical protein